MKLALTFFVIASLVGLSYQMRYIWPAPWAPRAHLMPLYYADGRPVDAQLAMDSLENKFGSLTNAVQPLFTVTRTATLTTTVEVGTPLVSECIVSSMFVFESSTPLTTPCPTSRRRRDVEAGDFIEPTATQLETTATLPDDQKSTPEIESSHESSDAWPSDAAPKRNFLGFSLTRTVFVTSYETEYTFTPIIVLNTVSMANDYALSCLPAGYTVCA